MVRDELKDALAYSNTDVDQVRFETADSREHPERLAEDHRRRLG
jgi:hypothetical protein